MTMECCCSKLPRPWYISLTAVWDDDSPNNKKLRTLLKKRELGKSGKEEGKGRRAFPLAGNHITVPLDCRHFTVLAILKINGHPPGTQFMRDFARQVFEPIRGDNALLGNLRASFESFSSKVDRVRCFDDGMTVEFKEDDVLKKFRDQARCILDEPVARIANQHEESEFGRYFKKQWGVELVESILHDSKKNYGGGAFGSIARSPCRCDRSIERWRKEIDYRITLTFDRIHLLISDEMLTNPRNRDEDVPIEPGPHGRQRTRRAPLRGRPARQPRTRRG